MEENSSYAWYVNMNNGNQNNNNRYSALYVRAVAAFQLDKRRGGFSLSDELKDKLLEDMIQASRDCLQDKRNSSSALDYLPGWQFKLIDLVDSIIAGKWRPNPLGVFIKSKPTTREIFTSDFIDRIVDTYIATRLEPLMDVILTNSATACRAGLGTSASVKFCVEAIRRSSDNYTKDCWVMTYDTRSYYMSIDKLRLLGMILKLVDDNYNEEDKEILSWLIIIRLMSDPCKDVVFKSPKSAWEKLPPHKSKFNQPKGRGITIGLLLTNESANIYMADIDMYIRKDLEYGDNYGRNIDDCWVVGTDKDKMLHDMALIRAKYAEYGLTIHPDKFYFQHYSKGVKVQNAWIKPGRVYITKRPLTNCFKKLHWWNEQARENVTFQIENVEKFVACINSYLGMLQNKDEFNMRKRICEKAYEIWQKVCYPERKDFTKMIIRKHYKPKNRTYRSMKRRRRYFKALSMLSTPIKNVGPESKATPKTKISFNQWIGRNNITDLMEEVTSEDGKSTVQRAVPGMKTWIEMRFDHEPTMAEIAAIELPEE